jgi:recombination protein RecA
VEIYGPESSGKTTLTLHIIAAAQRAGGVCAFVDAEHALDTKYAVNLGVDLDRLYFNQPDSGENGIDMVRDLVATGKFMVVVVDSVAALEPEAEQFKKGKKGMRSVRDSVVGAQARLMSKALRSLGRLCAKSDTLLIFTNQLREKIGVMFGSPETTPGGKALKFYASIRLDVRKVKTLKKGDRAIGHRARIKAAKNKAAPPFREIHADVFPNVGIKTVYADPEFDDGSDDEKASDASS